jgi:hypothetical protein
MTFRARLAPPLLVAVPLLLLAASSIASAQDVMELDLAFKNGLLQENASTGRQARDVLQGRRHACDARRKVQGRIGVKKR